MKLRGIVVEDFCNYKLPSLFLISAECDWKCCIEQGIDTDVCQNRKLTSAPISDISDEEIYNVFASNRITKAVVIGGLEPLLQVDEIDHLISVFREHGNFCDFVIYTGYYPNEVADKVSLLARHCDVIVKYGRYIPNSHEVYDSTLGITLASSNQFAIRYI